MALTCSFLSIVYYNFCLLAIINEENDGFGNTTEFGASGNRISQNRRKAVLE